MTAAQELRQLELAAACRGLRQVASNCKLLATGLPLAWTEKDAELLKQTVKVLALASRIIDRK